LIPRAASFFVENATNGLLVFVNNSKVSGNLSSGQLIDIVGFTTPGDFAPAIAKAVITVQGTATLRRILPRAVRMSAIGCRGG